MTERKVWFITQKDILLPKRARAEDRGDAILQNRTENNTIPAGLEKLMKSEIFQHRWLWARVSDFPDCSVKETHNLLRHDPAWYMQKELIEDCAEQDGWCSRNYDCCTKHHLTADSQIGAGYCTTACDCCAMARGFEDTETTEQQMDDFLDDKWYAQKKQRSLEAIRLKRHRKNMDHGGNDSPNFLEHWDV
ncbi:hypothetical protein N7508_008139 [Penicillium antarcticum]|uniref:uncharacterized protein n=1 Tax=Penicillium antarcticum TaxID=416450 RepID=UPI0023918D86|nr:uncharacterized protein N7508_008139 [Penicillium antarcticum]KAJ5297890.1 hypothetical protein N7508_008139 [Penicillium antarcticum]